MTGAEWKKAVISAADTVWITPYLTEAIDNPPNDTMETVNVILETLPGISETEIERAFAEAERYEVAWMEEMEPLIIQKERAATDDQWELAQAEILEKAMEQLNQMDLLDPNPSLHDD